MITDEKRREVAAKMRGYDVSEFKVSAIVPFLDCLGVGYLDWRGILDSLADLIDRPTCHDTGELANSFTCSECGFHESKLTVNPFTLSFSHIKPSYCYCPNCGAVIVDDKRLKPAEKEG